MEDEKKIFHYKRRNVRTKLNRLPPIRLRVRDPVTGKNIDDYEFHMHPHYLRRCRITDLKENHGFDHLQLTAFAGWTDSRPAMVYTEIGWQSLVKAMMKKN